MAQKSVAPAKEQFPLKTMRFRIEGAVCKGDTIIIQARGLNVDFHGIERILYDAGIPKEIAPMYVERIARILEQGELARHIADHMERVG